MAKCDDSAHAREVKSSHHDVAHDAAKALENIPLAMAKAKVGAVIRAAIGNGPLKAYGHEGLVSGVCSGEKAPDYLARIVADKSAKQRLALALLEDDSDVVVTTHIRIRRRKTA